jgi:enoyl-CoA hydratase/carnithine racemase
MSRPVTHSRAYGIDVLTLDSGANANALSLAMMEELTGLVRDSAAGDGRALLIGHTGRVFCAGVDLKERGALPRGDGRHSARLTDLLCALWDFPKPLLCHIDGAVRGGGMGIVACADIAVCSPASSFAYSEVRVGVAAALVTAFTLPKLTSAALLPVLITGETFGAEEAARLGLVTGVADGPTPEALETELAAIRRSAPGAMATTKAMVRQLSGIDVRSNAEQMGALSAALFDGDEAEEGMAAFAERRAPSWSLSV